MHQVGRERRQSIVLTLRPAIFDRYILAADETGFAHAPTERGQQMLAASGGSAVEPPDHRHRRLLRARRERPRRRAAEKRNELPPPHSITSLERRLARAHVSTHASSRRSSQ